MAIGQLDPDVKSYHDAMEVYWEFSEPHFTLASRLVQFWRGKLPEQLEGTFSKIMLNVAYAICQERIPKYIDNLTGSDKLITLTAENPLAEFLSDQAESWLNHELLDESRQNYRQNIFPTLQSVSVIGTGFRMPYVKPRKEGENTLQDIYSKDVDFFQILPAPNSGFVNPLDRDGDDALDGFMFMTWWTDEQIKTLKNYKGHDKDQIAECLKSKPDAHGQFGSEYIDKFTVLGGVSYGDSKLDWRRRMNDVNGTSGRRRITIWFKRDGMQIYANDYWKLYKGDNPMPNGLLPLSVYKAVPDFQNFHGISNLEMNEDVLIAFLMNFNFRMDYLTRIMFPAKWIRADVLQGKSESEFDYSQDAVHTFPQTNAHFDDLVHYDRMPEITNQTFIDEDRMKMVLQMVAGQPNYSHGMPSQGTLENRTATGIVSLIQQAEGRLTTESIALEEFGLRQEARLLLALAEKHIHRDLFVRLSKPSGFQWTTIEAEALSDMYTVHTHGTRYMAQREQQFQRLMALYPLWNQDPSVDQAQLKERIGEAAGINRLDELLIPDEMSMGMGMGAGPAGAPGIGQSGPQDLGQRTRGQENRQTVEAGTGRRVANTAF